jgi:hypothetical protein
MMGLLPSGKLRAVAGLIAAYAVALQAVFSVLAPIEVRADGTLAVYCSGSGSAVSPDAGDPGAPAPASGKMQCVFCGACASGFGVLPGAAALADLPVERPLSLVRESCCDRPAAIHVRDGPARAPPLTV